MAGINVVTKLRRLLGRRKAGRDCDVRTDRAPAHRAMFESLERRELMSAVSALDWANYIGGDDDDRVMAIAVDQAGYIYAAGVTDSLGWVEDGFDTTFNGGIGGSDAFVAKYDQQGNHIWSTYLGGSDDDVALGVTVDAFGSIVVVGGTYSAGWVSGGFNEIHNGTEDAFVVKIDSTGQLIWSTYLGGIEGIWAHDVMTDTQGNILVTGRSTTHDVNFDEIDDAFLYKLNTGGQLIWSMYYGGVGDDQANAIALAADGSILLAGTTFSPDWIAGGFDTLHNDGSTPEPIHSDGFVLKTDADGQAIWSTYVGGSAGEFGQDVAVDSLGNVYVVGRTSSTSWISGGWMTEIASETAHDGFLVKLDSNGQHVWSSYIGGDMNEEDMKVVVGPHNHVLVGGQSRSAGWVSGGYDTDYNGGVLSHPNLTFEGDAFVVELDASGAHVASTYLGGDRQDAVWGLAFDSGGHLLVGGHSRSSNVNWTDNDFKGGEIDGFVARFATAVVTPEIAVVGATVSIHSGDVDPSLIDLTDFGQVRVNEFEDAEYQIRNLGGAMLTLTGNPLVEITGPHADDFQVIQLPEGSVDADDETTFVIRFTPTGEGQRTATVTIASDDSDEGMFTFAISGEGLANQPPVNAVPADQQVNEDSVLTFAAALGNAISISDPDAGDEAVMVSLSAMNGWLTLSGLAGLNFTQGDGVADAMMTFTGSIADINAALEGLIYAPTADYFGADMLTIVTNDQGHTGGPALDDVDNINIDVLEQPDGVFSSAGRFVMLDNNGVTVTFTLRGLGGGNVWLALDGSISLVDLVGTTASSSLTITTRGGDGRTTIDNIDIDGSIRSLSARTTNIGPGGSVDIAGTASTIALGHFADQHELNIGAPNTTRDKVRITLDRVVDLTINSLTPIGSLTVTDWTDTDPAINPDMINAPWIGTLASKGNRSGVAGNFMAGLNLNGAGSPRQTLNRATIKGELGSGDSMNPAVWNITGDANSITSGDVDGWMLNLMSSIRSLRLGDVSNASLNVDDVIGRITAVRWRGGMIEGASLGTLSINGERRRGVEGDFSAHMTLSGANNPRQTLGRAAIKGELGSDDEMNPMVWNITGDVNSITSGDVNGWTLNVMSNVRTLRLGDVEHAVISIDDDLSSFTAIRTDDVMITARDIRTLRTTGHRGRGIAGDFNGEVNVNSIGAMSIAADLAESVIDLLQAAVDRVFALRTLTVRGMISDTMIYSRGHINSVTAQMMHNSGLMLGVAMPGSLMPATADDFDAQANLRTLRLRQRDAAAFVDSMIAAWSINTIDVGMVAGPAAQPFGVVADRIGSYHRRTAAGSLRLRNLDAPTIADTEADYIARIL